jgi:hypothetical protein
VSGQLRKIIMVSILQIGDLSSNDGTDDGDEDSDGDGTVISRRDNDSD